MNVLYIVIKKIKDTNDTISNYRFFKKHNDCKFLL